MDSVGTETARRALRELREALAASYVLERELGRGGMATVHLARDLRHGRRVAIKVLHPELSAILGPARFLKEIELTAALQHPHILPLFDSGSSGGLLWYVMPYVEGETLRARLERERQLPVEDAVRIAREVASALDYAHRQGVIHRDIKPENILLQDGSALVADFGIALAVQEAGGARMTQTGLSLGTPQYMAPEQALGERSVGLRADVYALGAVLYEMLAGEPPFTGPTAQAIVGRVMTEAPRPLAVQRSSVPPHVELAVRTALARVPADRFASAAAFAAALAAPAAPGTSIVRRHPMSRTTVALLTAGALAAGAALGWVGGWARGRAAADGAGTEEPVRFVIEPDSGTVRRGTPAISPDGRTVVFALDGPDGARLYARRVNELTARPIAGTEGGEWPFFSPDGAWLGFYSDGAIRKVRLDSGTVVLVARPGEPILLPGGAWGANDTIFYGTPRGALYRVPAAGGAPVRVAVQDSLVRVYTAQLLPDGKSALVSLVRGVPQQAPGIRMGVLDLVSGRTRVIGVGWAPRWARGFLVYSNTAGELFRRPFDLERMAPTGAAEEIARDVASPDVNGIPSVDVSPSGAIVFRVGFTAGPANARMALVDRAGREVRAFATRAPWTPRFSPDGRRLTYGANAPGEELSDVWVTDLASGTTERVTTDGADNNDPHWSPDGRSIAYSAIRERSGKDLFVRALDGGATRQLPSGPLTEWPSDWSPDGDALLFTGITNDNDRGIWIQPTDGGAPRPYLATPAQEFGARVSPDGRWVAYTSNETGRDEVYVQSYPVPGRKTLVSPRGGAHPVWRRDGRELYYWQDDQLVAVAVDPGGPGPTLVVRGRTPLFQAPYVQSEHPNYDASLDGTQFVVVTGRVRANRLVVALHALDAGGAAREGR